MVRHILLYGCELWGLSKCDIIERVHLKYCNPLLNLKSSTPNCMIHSELGLCPLHIDIKQGMCHTGPNVKQENSQKFACCASFSVPFT